MIRRWRSSNCWLGRPYGPPIAFVIHTEAGGESGTVAEFLSSSSQLSTHYAVGLDGSVECFVDPNDRAWSNGILEPDNLWTAIATDSGVDPALNPNHITISCETEDLGEHTLKGINGPVRPQLVRRLARSERALLNKEKFEQSAPVSATF